VVPRPVYLPALLHTAPCKPDSRHADIVLVIDSSGSMSETTSAGGPTKLAAAQDAARSFLGRLVTGRDQAALIQFNTAATVLVPLTGDIGAVTAGLGTLSQASGTRIDLALDAAAAELVGPNRRADNVPVIILLTDGEPTGASPEEVRQAAARAKAAGALVFTIGLGQALDAGLLTDLASRPDWYLPAPDTSDLAAIYARIVVEIPCKPMWPSRVPRHQPVGAGRPGRGGQ
jgi:Mg-chelatase subunit ChlD